MYTGQLESHGGKQKLNSTGKRDLEKEIWRAGFKYSWKKMLSQQNRTEVDDEEWTVVDYTSLTVTRHIRSDQWSS